MDVAVILATFEQPRWLEKVLLGYAVQTDPDFEMIVADDGSGPETAQVVEAFRQEHDLPVRHLWQEDRGFRKTRIQNLAIRDSRASYLIFSDGDCIPRRDFVETHRRLARPGHFLSGMAIRLNRTVSQAIQPQDIRTGRLFRPGWLYAQGFNPGRRALKLLPVPGLGRILDGFSSVPARFDAGNASAWRQDLLGVNGFDNRMGYGLEDQSLGWRLENAGITGLRVRNRAICLHLEHSRPYRDQEAMAQNAQVRDRIRQEGIVRAEDGLEELESVPVTRL